MAETAHLDSQGFTLIELLISVSIIAILIAIAIASYATVNKQSRDTKRKSDIEQMRSALEMWRADNGSYPAPPIPYIPNSKSFIGATDGLTDSLVAQDYLPAIPTDPLPALHGYFYEPTDYDLNTSKYYGYCVCSFLETNQVEDTQCEDPIPFTPGDPGHSSCIYGRRNP